MRLERRGVSTSVNKFGRIDYFGGHSLSWTSALNNCALTDDALIILFIPPSPLLFSRASLDEVFFPSVTLCNINQGRRSFFLENGLNHDSEMLRDFVSSWAETLHS